MHLLRTSIVRAALLSLFGLAFGTSCNKGDLGAPCNHGDIVPPQSPTKVSFPITDCNENLCLYATVEPPANNGDCNEDSDCAPANLAEKIYMCKNSRCVVTESYALQSSMCSRQCHSDSDCENTAINKVVYGDTLCKSKKFICQYMQSTGPLCCTKLCVCSDQRSESTHDKVDDQCKNNADVKMNCANL